jgi:hypothetical protein
MLGFYEKRKLRKILYSKPFIALLCIPTTFLGFAALNAYKGERQTEVKAAEVAHDLTELTTRQAILEAEVNRLGTTRGIEEEIRRKFDVAREGERVLILVDGEKKVSEPKAPPVEEGGLLEKFFGIFGF